MNHILCKLICECKLIIAKNILIYYVYIHTNSRNISSNVLLAEIQFLKCKLSISVSNQDFFAECLAEGKCFFFFLFFIILAFLIRN